MLRVRVGITNTSLRFMGFIVSYNSLFGPEKQKYMLKYSTTHYKYNYIYQPIHPTIIHSFITLFIQHTIHSSYYSFIHSSYYSFIHHTIHSFIIQFTHSPPHSLPHSLPHSFIHSFIHSTYDTCKTFNTIRLHTSACCGGHFAAQILINAVTFSRAFPAPGTNTTIKFQKYIMAFCHRPGITISIKDRRNTKRHRHEYQG